MDERGVKTMSGLIPRQLLFHRNNTRKATGEVYAHPGIYRAGCEHRPESHLHVCRGGKQRPLIFEDVTARLAHSIGNTDRMGFLQILDDYYGKFNQMAIFDACPYWPCVAATALDRRVAPLAVEAGGYLALYTGPKSTDDTYMAEANIRRLSTFWTVAPLFQTVTAVYSSLPPPPRHRLHLRDVDPTV